jgi:uncharacterized membrane protein
MLASLSHADLDSTYSLFAFFALLTHPQYNSIREVLLILIAVTVLVILSDFWVIGLLGSEEIGGGNRFFGYLWTVVEILLKIWLIVMLSLWRSHINEEDSKKARRQSQAMQEISS